ncbi:MAG: SDR family oxidoreductase [Candidatus Acidiferrales bacterium]
MDWKDKVTVVTGASSGIGRAVALAFAAKGMTVVLVGRDALRLDAAIQTARQTGSRVLAVRADLTHGEEIDHVRAVVEHHCGATDILVHSAGIFFMGSLDKISACEYEQMKRTNLCAPQILTRALLSLLSPARSEIVFMNSSAALSADPNIAAYAETKRELRHFADCLRQELNPTGTRVLSVYLGRTATPMQEAIHALEGKTYRPELLIQPEDVATAVFNALDMPRTAEITDINIRPAIKS